MTKECKQQFTLRITQANSTEMIVILYEMMLCYLGEAREALADQNILAFRESLRKSRGCLQELMQSLHMEYDPAPVLLQLYFYCLRRLAHCELRKNEQDILQIEKVILPLKEAYEQIANQNTKGSVMGNSQTIYAGLTYGRRNLTENMTDQGTNRGMLV